MTLDEAVALLGLPRNCEDDDLITQQYQELYSDFQVKITHAPLPHLRQKLQKNLDDINTAYKIVAERPRVSGMHEYPASIPTDPGRRRMERVAPQPGGAGSIPNPSTTATPVAPVSLQPVVDDRTTTDTLSAKPPQAIWQRLPVRIAAGTVITVALGLGAQWARPLFNQQSESGAQPDTARPVGITANSGTGAAAGAPVQSNSATTPAPGPETTVAPTTPKPAPLSASPLYVQITGIGPAPSKRLASLFKSIGGVAVAEGGVRADLTMQGIDRGDIRVARADGDAIVARLSSDALDNLLPVLRREVDLRELNAWDNPATAGNVQLQFRNNKTSYSVGDSIAIQVTSKTAGYLTLVDVSADGSIAILHPNRFEDVGLLTPGKQAVIDGLIAGLPRGPGVTRALVTEKPLFARSLFDTMQTDFIAHTNGPTLTARIRRGLERQMAAGAKTWSTDAVVYTTR